VKFEIIHGNISQPSSYIRIFYFNIKPHLSKHGEPSTQKPSWRSISALVMPKTLQSSAKNPQHREM
jgi:hypothetical protein